MLTKRNFIVTRRSSHLNDLNSYKEKKGEKFEKCFVQEKNNLKKLKRDAFSKNSKLDIYNQILSQNFEYYDLKTNEKIGTTEKLMRKFKNKLFAVYIILYFRIKMVVNGYTYAGKFEGNILVLGQTACGKTTFIQNVGKSKLFGNIKDVIWLTIFFCLNREKTI